MRELNSQVSRITKPLPVLAIGCSSRTILEREPVST